MNILTYLAETGHPTSDMIVGIPLGALLVWAVKILYNVTKVQNEMLATLFGTEQVPGAIPRQAKEIEEVKKSLHRVRSSLQAVALKSGINSFEPPNQD